MSPGIILKPHFSVPRLFGRSETILRLIIGISILLFGIIALAVAITSIPSSAQFQYILGMILPSGVLITAGILILSFRRGSSIARTKNS